MFKFTIRFKLRAGLVSQIVLIVIIIVSLAFLKRQIDSISAESELLLDESKTIQHFAFDIKDYFNSIITFEDLSSKFNTARSKITGNVLEDKLAIIWESIELSEQKEQDNSKISDEVFKLADNSISMSDGFIKAMSGKLADVNERYAVTTLERLVLGGAVINSGLNHNVKFKFKELKEDINTKVEFVNYLDAAIENSGKDVERLKNTPFAQLPVQAQNDNKAVKGLALQYIQNLEDILELEATATYNLNSLLEGVNELNTDTVNKANRKILVSMTISLIVLIVLSLVVIFINGSTSIAVGKFIRQFSIYIKNIGNGNLGIKPGSDLTGREDEFGSISRDLKATIENVSLIVKHISGEAESITSIGTQLSSSSQQISSDANQQAASIEEVSSSMEEMVANIEQNTDNAAQTEKISSSSAQGVQQVGKASEESLSSVRNIATKITIVNDIAFQTNLLALNAAVEAARAGEHGKGFAVVAAEVRKLAERSKIAADEIDKLSHSSLQATEESGQLMNTIIPEIIKTSQLIQEISSASNEQRTGAEQVNSALQQLNNITQQNAASSEELAGNAQQLAERAEKLREIISFFKTSDGGQTKIYDQQIRPEQRVAPREVSTSKSTPAKPGFPGSDEKGGEGPNFDMGSDDDFERF